MPWDTLHKIQCIHYDFLRHFLEASQFDRSPASAIPTFIFFVFTFILVHSALHRYSSPLTPLSIRIYRELGFQWSYFYIVRLWFLTIKSVKWITNWSEDYLEVLHFEEKLLWLNHIQVQASLFAILTFIGILPFAVVVVNCFWQQTIPNFLLWAGEDPWIRSEIGISGHYLDRPPTFAMPKTKERAYRSRRSISVEYVANPKPQHPLRNCKSLGMVDKINSVNSFT